MYALNALPVPAALLDPDGRYLALNEASGVDPLLARAQVGSTDLDHIRPSEPAWQHALERRRCVEQCVHTRAPASFTETPRDTQQLFTWTCIPLLSDPEGVRYVALLGFALEHTAAASSSPLQLYQDLRSPLIAIVSLANLLVDELKGRPKTRATTIEQAGRRMLRYLDALRQQPKANGSGSS